MKKRLNGLETVHTLILMNSSYPSTFYDQSSASYARVVFHFQVPQPMGWGTSTFGLSVIPSVSQSVII